MPVPRGRVSPVGWDKSHPLDPVEAVNPEMTRSATGLYKQNMVSQLKSGHPKYSSILIGFHKNVKKKKHHLTL